MWVEHQKREQFLDALEKQLLDPTKQKATRLRQNAADSEEKIRLAKLDAERQQEIFVAMSQCNNTEIIENNDPTFVKSARTQLQAVASNLSSTLFIFMFHGVPKEVQTRSDETLFDAYITALVDRLVILMRSHYTLLHCTNNETLYLADNISVLDLYGYQEDVEGRLSDEVIQFTITYRKEIMSKLKGAGSKKPTEHKSDEENPVMRIPDTIKAQGDNDTITKWCINYLAENNIFPINNTVIKGKNDKDTTVQELVATQLEAYITYRLSYVRAMNLKQHPEQPSIAQPTTAASL